MKGGWADEKANRERRRNIYNWRKGRRGGEGRVGENCEKEELKGRERERGRCRKRRWNKGKEE